MSLEEQIEELNDTVELLTLDKEQLLFEKEVLEEKCQQLQSALDEALARTAAILPSPAKRSPAVDVKETEEYKRLAEEHEKYKDALVRLAEASNQGKQQIQSQAARILELEALVTELQTYKEKAEEQLEELRQSVDSMSAYEAMIERLTNDNLDLSAKYSEAKQTIAELEDTLELNDQLDHQQRREIDEHKRAIESLQIALSQQERRLQEKDSLTQEYVKKLEQVKELYSQSKREAERLNVLLSTEFQESKAIENKLQEAAALRVQHDTLTQEVSSLKSQCAVHWQQRMRYTALYTHADRIFGGHALYLEESKLFNTEILALSTISTGLEANRGLSELLQTLMQSLSVNNGVVTDGSAVAVADAHPLLRALLTPLHTLSTLSLQLQGGITHGGLSLCRTAASTTSESESLSISVTLCLSVRSLFESIQTQQLHVFRDLQHFLHSLRSAREELSATEREREEERLLSFNALFFEHAAQLEALSLTALTHLRTFCSSTNETEKERTESCSPSEVQHLFAHKLRETLSSESSSHTTTLCVETALLLLSLHAEYRLLAHSAGNDTHPLSVEEEEVMRSIKIELDTLFKQCKFISASTEGKKHALTLIDASAQLVTFIAAAQIEKESATARVDRLKSTVLIPLRRIAATVIDVGTLSLSQSFPNMKYFPAQFIASATVRGKNAKALDEQLQQLQDKLWALLLQGNNDLLPNGSSLAWKQRSVELRQIVSLRLSSSSDDQDVATEPSVSAKSQKLLTPAKSSFAAQESAVSKQQLQQLVHELNVKKDELRSAMNKCEELERLIQTQSEQVGKASANEEEVQNLQKELKTLEAALSALETKSDQLSRENKALKQQVLSLGGNVESGSSKEKEKDSSSPRPVASSAAVATGSAPVASRRRSQADVSASASTSMSLSMKAKSGSVDKDIFNLLKSASATSRRGSVAASGAASATSVSTSASASSSAVLNREGLSVAVTNSVTNNLSVSITRDASSNSALQEKVHALSEEARFWKHFAVKKLAASLLPLETASLSPAGSENTLTATGDAVEISVNKVTGDASRDFHVSYLQLRKDRVRRARVPVLKDPVGDEKSAFIPSWRSATLQRGNNLAFKILCRTTLHS